MHPNASKKHLWAPLLIILGTPQPKTSILSSILLDLGVILVPSGPPLGDFGGHWEHKWAPFEHFGLLLSTIFSRHVFREVFLQFWRGLDH